MLARRALPTEGAASTTALKLGEWPPFGERVPQQALRLIEQDRALFLKGRTAENRGLGIGAFAYYRRVVQNQKASIIEAIRKAAETSGATSDVLVALARARDNWRFEGSIDEVRDLIPETLKVKGHNPLVLLHSALSEGLHEGSDENCLDRAETIRLVLVELADRIAEVTRETKQLDEAIGRLLKQSADAAPSAQASEGDKGPAR